MKLLLGPALHCVWWILLREQLQECAASLLDFGRVRFHLHAIDGMGGTRRNEMTNSLDANQTETTRARRLEPVIVAERRDFHAGQSRSLQ